MGQPQTKESMETQKPSFLINDHGQEIFREAQDRAQKQYGSAQALLAPVYNGGVVGVVQGSNPFYVALVNEILRSGSQRLRTATPADIEKTLRAGDILGIKGKHYIDTALVLRSERDSYEPNDPLSRDLYKQVKRRVGKRSKLPVMIPLNGLDLRVDKSSSYGLGFDLREDAEIVHAPILNQPGRFNTEDIDTETGLPIKTGSEGSRQLYTRKDGLSRLNLYRDLYLDANWVSLGNSLADGRVALCGEAAPNENLDVLLTNHVKSLEAERDKQTASATERFARALEILKGKQ